MVFPANEFTRMLWTRVVNHNHVVGMLECFSYDFQYRIGGPIRRENAVDLFVHRGRFRRHFQRHFEMLDHTFTSRRFLP